MADSRARILLFDIDGTLIRCGGAGMRSLLWAVEAVCGPPTAPTGDGQRIVPDGMTDPVLIERALRELYGRPPAGPDELDAIVARYLTRLTEALADEPGYTVLPGVPALLEALQAQPLVALGLGTGNLEASARIKLQRGGLDDYFAFGGFGSDAGDRAALLAAGRARGEAALGQAVEPQQVIVVGDTDKDVAAAMSNGFRVLGVATGRRTIDDLLAYGADRAVPTLEDTAQLLRMLLE